MWAGCTSALEAFKGKGPILAVVHETHLLFLFQSPNTRISAQGYSSPLPLPGCRQFAV